MIGRVTTPNGRVMRFIDLHLFDAYVRTWREAGFALSWADPRTVTISRAPA